MKHLRLIFHWESFVRGSGLEQKGDHAMNDPVQNLHLG